MIDPKKLEQLARQVQKSLPKSIRDLSHDMEKTIHQILQNQFSRMDLVSREEFDVQTQVLLRTREKLTQLEYRINALETIFKENTFVNNSVSENDAVTVVKEKSSMVKKVDNNQNKVSSKMPVRNTTLEEDNEA